MPCIPYTIYNNIIYYAYHKPYNNIIHHSWGNRQINYNSPSIEPRSDNCLSSSLCHSLCFVNFRQSVHSLSCLVSKPTLFPMAMLFQEKTVKIQCFLFVQIAINPELKNDNFIVNPPLGSSPPLNIVYIPLAPLFFCEAKALMQ